MEYGAIQSDVMLRVWCGVWWSVSWYSVASCGVV